MAPIADRRVIGRFGFMESPVEKSLRNRKKLTQSRKGAKKD